MRVLRFHHVFLALLLLSFLCAFILPTQVSDSVRGNFRVLFAPVSWPTRAIASAFSSMISPQRARDDGATDPGNPRDVEAILQENQQLRAQMANLTGQIDRLNEREAQRASVGEVRELCVPSRVLGASADPALRESLQIGLSSVKGAQKNAPVLHALGGGGIAGTIARADVAGSAVQLITDSKFAVRVGFARFVKRADGKLEFTMIATNEALATGDGKGALWVRNVPWQQATEVGLQVGDWVVLRDDDWPDALQRYRIGRIEAIDRYSKGAGFAEIKVAPPTKLLQLREVLVMVK